MRDILISPFSNSDIRDWPTQSYAALVGLLAERWTGGGMIHIVGAPNQALRAREIVRHANPERAASQCGRWSWDEVVARLREAACVIGNNSGIAHLAGSFDVPTVCLFGGSHQRLEWRPTGPRVTLLSRAIGCSPCHLDHKMVCPYDKACLREISPTEVAEIVLGIVGEEAE